MTTDSTLLPQRSVGAAGAVGAAAPAPGRRRARWRLSWSSLIPVATTVGLLALWELLARVEVAPSEIPPFTDVARWLVRQRGDAAFWNALEQTLWHWFGGLLIGGVAGVVVGGAIGMAPVVQRLLNLPLEFLRPIPAIVYLPLLILELGTRSTTATILASVGAFWPMLFQSIYGVRAVDRQVVETAKVFGLKRRQILRHIMLPSVLPYLATGLRIASSLALVVGIGGELVAGVPGLGASLRTASLNSNYPATWGLLLVSGLLGLVLNSVLERGEHRLLRWHVSHRVVAR